MADIMITIDGQSVAGRSGDTILDAARRAGLGERIPTLCHDPALPPYTSCFVCVVEQEGVSKLLPACSQPASDGMKIRTDTERVQVARKTALELLLSNHPADCVAPCVRGCPAGVDVQTYLALAREEKFVEAVKVIRQTNPLPIVCGRVCVRKCEEVCRRTILDSPVGINMVKRAASDWWRENPYEESAGPDSGKKVAVIGGGPAGLTAACFLRRMGHAVTVFEMRDKLGGMLRWGIPDYRLPQDMLDWEIDSIIRLGVEVKTGVRVGRDVTVEALREQFDAVYLAVGAQKGSAAHMKGEDHPSVLAGLDFLIGVKEGKSFPIAGRRVAVIGGGNTAIDAARTALRLGASHVAIIYRRTRAEMPANVEEIEAAENEGIRLEFLIAPVSVAADGERLEGVVCQRMQLGEPDSSGRRRPVPLAGSEHLFACDIVLAAIGQSVDMEGISDSSAGFEVSRWGTLKATGRAGATSVPGVFVGGDCLTGPSVVIDAIAAGRLAALGIAQYFDLGGKDVHAQATACAGVAGWQGADLQDTFSSRRENFGDITALELPKMEAIPRAHQHHMDVAVRVTTFEEVEDTLADHQAVREAERCLSCGCTAREDCDLRMLAHRYGLGKDVSGQTSRRRLDTSHPLIAVDPNKCILCTRCIRTCDDILGIAALGLVDRGFETYVAPSLGKPLIETDCVSCGNCVDACPTGALAFRNLSATAKAAVCVESVCTLCGEVCPVAVTQNVFGQAVRALVREDGRRRQLCALGRFGNVAMLSGARITSPMVRRDGTLVSVGWDEAIETALAGMKKIAADKGAGALLFSGGPDLTCEEAAWLAFVGRKGFGAATASLTLLGCGSDLHEADAFFGTTRSTISGDDMERASLILVVGADPLESNPVAAARLRRALRNGAKVVSVTSAPTAVTRHAALRLETRRGSTSLLLGQVVKQLLEQGVASQGAPVAELLSGLSSIDADRVVRECGVDRQGIDSLVAALHDAQGSIAAVFCPEASRESSPGTLLLLAEIVELLRPVDAASGLLLWSPHANRDGLRAAGLTPGTASDAVALAGRISQGGIAAAWIVREDPDESADLARALGQATFLVVQDVFMTATASRADVVFPASLHFETGGTILAPDGRLFALQPTVPGRIGRSTAELLAAVATRLGLAADVCPMPGELAALLSSKCATLPHPDVVSWPVPAPENKPGLAPASRVASVPAAVRSRLLRDLRSSL